MFERFTDRARTVLVLAQEDARQLHHGYMGTEHILLGLIREGDGIGARTLTSFGLTLDAVRHEVEEMLGGADETSLAAQSNSPPFSPRAKKALELALREALQLGHHYIGTEHILLGLVREADGVAAQVLMKLGVDLELARRRVKAVMSSRPAGDQTTDAPAGAGAGAADAPFTTVERRTTEPRCPRCRADLTEDARFRTIQVSPEAQESEQEPRPLYAVYCGKCGVSLHMFTPNQ